jgi:hypothetical protein
MRTLVFITAHFPFGSGETFIDSEYPYLSKSFDQIIVIAQDFSGQQTRNIYNNTSIYRYNPATTFIGFLILPFQLLAATSRIVKLINDEAIFRKSIRDNLTTKRFSFFSRKLLKRSSLRTLLPEYLENILLTDQ